MAVRDHSVVIAVMTTALKFAAMIRFTASGKGTSAVAQLRFLTGLICAVEGPYVFPARAVLMAGR